MISSEVTPSGPDGEPTTNKLSESLRQAGLKTFRLKTGTPPRVLTESIDFSKTTPQPGTDQFVAFSTTTQTIRKPEDQKLCYLTYTTPQTHELILANLKKSSMYSGVVKGVGPRYCPSIEDKLVRFPISRAIRFFWNRNQKRWIPPMSRVFPPRCRGICRS